MKVLAVLFALLFCDSAYSQLLKDTIFSINGTVVVGKLLSIKLGQVTFDPDDANDITIQLRKIKTFGAARKIFRIETVDQKVHFGTMLSHPDLKKVFIATGYDTVAINVEDISVLYPFDKSIAARFSGTVGVGFTYTKSSGFGRLNFDAKIKYASKKGELSLNTTGIYTIYDSLLSREKEELSLKYNYYFIRNWFATGFLVYQRNLELGLERRFQEGLGLGNKFITTKQFYSWARSGLVINQERGTDDVNSGVLTEIFGQLEINFFRFAKPKVNVILTENFYYSLSQAGRFRNDGALYVSWEIFKDFYFSLEPYNNFDSKPPVEGNDKFDFGIVFGINYKFY
jgi:hypothetical protein